MSRAIPASTRTSRVAVSIGPMQMPATLHHKTTAARGIKGGAALMAGAGHYAASGKGCQGLIAGMITQCYAKREQDYKGEHKSHLLLSASQDTSVGGYLIMWMDRDANATRCTCYPKYDTVAVPVRNHSPFTYEDMLAHARKEFDGVLWCYQWKTLAMLMAPFLIIAGIALLYYFTQLRSGLPVVNESQAVRQSRRLAFGGNAPVIMSGVVVPEGLTARDTRTDEDTPLWILLMPLMGYIVMMTVVMLILMLPFCCTNCCFFTPLRAAVNRVRSQPFWAQRKVKIYLTDPAKSCCGPDVMRHCIVFQYGRNGQKMGPTLK